jgi:Zn-dependent M28 family amino/carboxypeptidase
MQRPRTCLLVLLAALGWTQSTQLELAPVKREVVQERLGRFARKNKERESSLRQIFEEAGCAGERLREQKVKGSREPNVICTLVGEADSAIVVGAHFDFFPAGQGVVDNWSGASLLASLYEALAVARRRHTFLFVGFTAEEAGLVGARGFVRQMSPDEKDRLRGMVNLDSLGLSATKVWVSASDRKLVDLLASVALALRLPVEGVNADRVGSDDAHAFAAQKIPTISIHSVTQATLSVLHSPEDTLRVVNLDQYYDTYRLVLAYLAHLDQVLP